MEILGIFGRLLALGATVWAFLWARRMVAASAGIPQAFLPFRRFDAPVKGMPRWARPAIVCAGAIAVYLVTSLFFAAGIHVGGDVTVSNDGTIDVVQGGPAERAGVRDGDRITRIAGRAVHTWQEVPALVREHGRSVPLEVVLERDGHEQTRMVEPIIEEHGARIGVGPAGRAVDVGVGAAIGRGLVYPAQLVSEVARTLSGAPPVVHAIPAKMAPTPSAPYAFLLKVMGYLSLLVGIVLAPLGAFGWRPRPSS